MKNIPKKIYLQIGDDEFPPEKKGDTSDFKMLSGITWSEDRINKTDLVYYRRKSKKKKITNAKRIRRNRK